MRIEFIYVKTKLNSFVIKFRWQKVWAFFFLLAEWNWKFSFSINWKLNISHRQHWLRLTHTKVPVSRVEFHFVHSAVTLWFIWKSILIGFRCGMHGSEYYSVRVRCVIFFMHYWKVIRCKNRFSKNFQISRCSPLDGEVVNKRSYQSNDDDNLVIMNALFDDHRSKACHVISQICDDLFLIHDISRFNCLLKN